MMLRFRLVVLMLAIWAVRYRMAKAELGPESGNVYTLDSVREALIRQEESIVFALIDRAKFPINSHTYDENYIEIPGYCGSVVEFLVRNTEAVQAKAGRYQNPEENPFFPENLPASLVSSYPLPKDRKTLMKLLTFESVEEMVEKRVEKKAMVFGQDVSLNHDDNSHRKYKVDP